VKRLVHPFLAVLFLLLASSPSGAGPITLETAIFNEIDEVSAGRDNVLTIVGVPPGQTQAVERRMPVFADAFDACHKAALLVMELPGRYTFEVRFEGSTFEGCHLRRR
jgi:hypothetical protein